MWGTSLTGTTAFAYRLNAPAILRLGILLLLSLALVSVPVQAAQPVAEDDNYTVDEDSLDNRFDVLANDHDPDGDVLQIVAVTQGLIGTVTIVDGGARVSYTPDPQQFGSDHFTYTVDDGNGESDSARVDVTIRGINDPPWIDPVVPNQFADEDTAIVLDLSDYEHDLESSGADLDWTVSGERNCTVSGENSDDDRLTFTPHPNFAGSDIVRLTLSDPDGATDTQSIALMWSPVNDAPTLDPLPDRSLDEDATLDNAIDLWAYTSDPETADSNLSFAIDNAPNPNAGVTIDGNRYVDIRPAANWYGSTDVRITVTDPEGASDADTFRVTVRSVNDPPWIDPVVPNQFAAEDTAIVLDLSPYEHDL